MKKDYLWVAVIFILTIFLWVWPGVWRYEYRGGRYGHSRYDKLTKRISVFDEGKWVVRRGVSYGDPGRILPAPSRRDILPRGPVLAAPSRPTR